jgi:hypothetical protein
LLLWDEQTASDCDAELRDALNELGAISPSLRDAPVFEPTPYTPPQVVYPAGGSGPLVQPDGPALQEYGGHNPPAFQDEEGLHNLARRSPGDGVGPAAPSATASRSWPVVPLNLLP